MIKETRLEIYCKSLCSLNGVVLSRSTYVGLWLCGVSRNCVHSKFVILIFHKGLFGVINFESVWLIIDLKTERWRPKRIFKINCGKQNIKKWFPPLKFCWKNPNRVLWLFWLILCKFWFYYVIKLAKIIDKPCTVQHQETETAGSLYYQKTETQCIINKQNRKDWQNKQKIHEFPPLNVTALVMSFPLRYSK